MKTRTVTFSYGTVKDAALKIPAEAYSIANVTELIWESYFDYAFRPGCGLMSDAVLTSSIGQANFFAGALGGWQTRMDVKTFAILKEYTENTLGLALAVARHRSPGASQSEVCTRASQNEALSESDRAACAMFAKHFAAA